MNNFSIEYLTRNSESKKTETVINGRCVVGKTIFLDDYFDSKRSDGYLSSSSPQSAELNNSRSSSSSTSPPPSDVSSSSSSGETSPESSSPSSRETSSHLSGSLSLSMNTSTEKPVHSYIALISKSILNSPEKKVLLGDIYQYIMDNFPYYNNTEKAWRNSIRHNLSLNECFVKSGRAENGKGNYWSIHPACIEDFSRGDFRRRQARRRARKGAVSDLNVSDVPLNYRYSVNYVPMTSSVVNSTNFYPTGFYPYPNFPSGYLMCGSEIQPFISRSYRTPGHMNSYTCMAPTYYN